MPRRPNTPCVGCGKLCWPSNKVRSKSLGQKCHDCRRVEVKHGTQRAYYIKKCRCSECRAVVAKRVREYNQRVKARTGRYPHGPRRGTSRNPVTPKERIAIYERDGWICQLCFEPVDKTLDPKTDRWAATLDHVECQSWALIPDHSLLNLRLAHRACNSSRGSRVVV